MLSIAFLGVSTKCPGYSTKCFHHDWLELKCLPGPCGPWLLFSSQHPGTCSFPGNSLWPILYTHRWVFGLRFKGILMQILGLLLCTAPFILVPCPTSSSHLSGCVIWFLFLQLSKTVTPCVDYASLCSLKVSPGKRLGWSCGSPHLSPFLSQLSSVYPVVQHLKTVTPHIFFRFIVVYWGRTSPVAFSLLLARCMYLICITEVLICYPISIPSSVFPLYLPTAEMEKVRYGFNLHSV